MNRLNAPWTFGPLLSGHLAESRHFMESKGKTFEPLLGFNSDLEAADLVAVVRHHESGLTIVEVGLERISLSRYYETERLAFAGALERLMRTPDGPEMAAFLTVVSDRD